MLCGLSLDNVQSPRLNDADETVRHRERKSAGVVKLFYPESFRLSLPPFAVLVVELNDPRSGPS